MAVGMQGGLVVKKLIQVTPLYMTREGDLEEKVS